MKTIGTYRIIFLGWFGIFMLAGCAPRKLPTHLDQQAHKTYWKPTKYRQGWWYATGMFTDTTGKEYFHQFTIFHARRPLVKAFASHQSLSNPMDNNHRFSEHVYIENKLSGSNDSMIWAGADTITRTNTGYRLISHPPGKKVVVTLTIEKPLVLHGQQGIISMGHASKKKEHSVYFSHTRLSATGHVITPFDTLKITGTYWFDRQFGPFTELYWYWYSLRMNDGTEQMMFYFPGTGEQLYEEIDRDGRCEVVPSSISVADSTENQQEFFPMTHRIISRKDTLWITPKSSYHFNSNRIGPLYWEGPCTVLSSDADTIGHAVIELTGKRKPIR
ncbi:MAG: hypothetical protein H6608_12630 [Flavobacteriales bacterium]|nr:hypothetical protein [Flavobacteriales bacterium]